MSKLAPIDNPRVIGPLKGHWIQARFRVPKTECGEAALNCLLVPWSDQWLAECPGLGIFYEITPDEEPATDEATFMLMPPVGAEVRVDYWREELATELARWSTAGKIGEFRYGHFDIESHLASFGGEKGAFLFSKTQDLFSRALLSYFSEIGGLEKSRYRAASCWNLNVMILREVCGFIDPETLSRVLRERATRYAKESELDFSEIQEKLPEYVMALSRQRAVVHELAQESAWGVAMSQIQTGLEGLRDEFPISFSKISKFRSYGGWFCHRIIHTNFIRLHQDSVSECMLLLSIAGDLESGVLEWPPKILR